jgi:hypothetical protein
MVINPRVHKSIIYLLIVRAINGFIHVIKMNVNLCANVSLRNKNTLCQFID